MTSTNSNLQSVTFTDIGNLLFEINGGNVNGGITVSQGGISQLIGRTNIAAWTWERRTISRPSAISRPLT